MDKCTKMKGAKAAAKEAKRVRHELAKDPFNPDLLEKTGDVDLARKLRQRQARREVVRLRSLTKTKERAEAATRRPLE